MNRKRLLLCVLTAQACIPTTEHQDAAPIARVGDDVLVAPDEDVTLDGSASTDDGSIVSFHWDFGDNSAADGKRVTHAWSTEGAYIASLTVTDDAGQTGHADLTVTVSRGGLVAHITASPTTGIHVGDAITFDASGSMGANPITEFHWQFGDGATGTGATAMHAYSNSGSKRVLLQVRDGGGEMAETTLDVTVLPVDVAGVYDVTASPATYACQQYTAGFDETVFTISVTTDGTLTATTDTGKTYSGTLDGSSFTITTDFMRGTGNGCITAPVQSSIAGSFTSTGFTATAADYYNLNPPCNCSASFPLTATRR